MEPKPRGPRGHKGGWRNGAAQGAPLKSKKSSRWIEPHTARSAVQMPDETVLNKLEHRRVVHHEDATRHACG